MNQAQTSGLIAPLSQASQSPTLHRPARHALLAVCLCLGLVACGSSALVDFNNASAEKLYKEARDDLDSGAYDRAIKTLERIEALAAGTLLAQQAQLDLAYAQWRGAEKATALATVERFIKLNPSSPGLDYAMYLRGLINFNENLGLVGKLFGQQLSERDQRAARDAWQAFKQLSDQFPQSRYTPDAQAKMAHIVRLLAESEVNVARYYFRRGAYVAAANRAQQAVTEFPNSAPTEEALYLMMASYEKLELKDLRDDAQRVLRQNFPRSPYLAEGTGNANKPWWKFW